MRRLLLTLCLVTILVFSCSFFVLAAEGYTVVVQDENGTPTAAYSELTAQSTAPRPSEPLRSGKVFYGWLYSTDGGATFSEDIWDFSKPIGGDLILRASLRDAFSGGSGVYYDPYLLTSAADLHLLSALYQNNTELSRKTVYYRMENDIVLNADLLTDGVPRADATPFHPIGTATKSFRGHFDANGHTIYGLYIDLPTTDHVGLFSGINSDTIGMKSVSIADSFVRGSSYVGLVAGSICDAPTLTDLSLSGVVIATGDYAGGLCGTLENGSVSVCTADVIVSGRDRVGGIAGLGGTGSYFDRCIVSGKISGRTYAGGIVGYTAGTMILGGSTSAEITASESFAGGAAGIVTAPPYHATSATLSGFTFTGKVSAPRFVSPYLGLCIPSGILTENVTSTGQVTGTVPTSWSDAEALQVYMVSVTNGIPYCRNTLLSFVLTITNGDTVYRFATSDLISAEDTATLPLSASHVQSFTDTAVTLTLPCGGEVIPLRFAFTSIGTDMLLAVSAPTMPSGYSAVIAFGTSYVFGDTAELHKLTTSHATGVYATTEHALIACSFLSMQTGTAGSLTHCNQQLQTAPLAFTCSETAPSDVGLYGYTALSSTPAYALVSYRTRETGTPILLPAMQSIAVADSDKQQVSFGGGFFLLANGASGSLQASMPEHVRLALPTELDEQTTFLPVAVLLDAEQTAGVSCVTLSLSVGEATVSGWLPILVETGTSDLVTPTPTIVQNTHVTMSATAIYGFAPNGTLMQWELVDGTATCRTFPVGGTYWCILPTANGYFSVAELPLHIVTYTTPYITHPPTHIMDARQPTALTAPQVFPIQGYTFLGWYLTDATSPFDFTTPITASLTIEGRWELHKATITTQPQAQEKVFSPTIPATFTFAFDHVRAPELRFTYAWYYAPSASEPFTLLNGQTADTLDRFHVSESGLYYAEITATDGISTSVTRTEAVTLHITPLTVGRPTVTAPSGFPYTGYPLAVTFTDPHAYRAASGGIQTELGIYTATIELSGTTDYRWADGIVAPVTVEWSIIKRKVTLPAILGSYTYTGAAQAPVTTNHPDYTTTGATGTLAGSYPVTFALTDPVHCVWENGTATPYTIPFIIAPRVPLLVIYNSTKYFDGEPASVSAITDSTAKIQLIYRDENGMPILLPPTAPGTYSVTASVSAVPGKYAAAEVTQTLTILPAVYTVLWSNTQVTYNGETQLPSVKLYLNGVEVQDVPAYKLVCAEGDSVLPGSYSYKLVWRRPTLFQGLQNNTCTLTIQPRALSLDSFPDTLTFALSQEPLSLLSEYLPTGVTASIAPIPTTPGTHRALVSFTVPVGYASLAPRELQLNVLPIIRESADGKAWLSAEQGFVTNNLPQLATGSTEGLTLPNHDSATLYIVRGTNETHTLSFAGSDRMEVYLVTDGTLTLCTTVYDADVGCATLPAADGSYLVIDHEPFSPTLLVLLLGVGSTGIVCAMVWGVGYLRKKRTAK